MAGLTAGVIQAQKELREAGAAAYPSGIPVVHGVAAVGGVGEWADPSDSEQALTIASARVFTSGKEVRIQFSTWMVASEYPENGWTITAGARSITVLSGLVFSGGITLFTDEEIYKDEVVAGAFSDSTGSVTRFPIERNLASTSFAITNGSLVPPQYGGGGGGVVAWPTPTLSTLAGQNVYVTWAGKVPTSNAPIPASFAVYVNNQPRTLTGAQAGLHHIGQIPVFNLTIAPPYFLPGASVRVVYNGSGVYQFGDPLDTAPAFDVTQVLTTFT